MYISTPGAEILKFIIWGCLIMCVFTGAIQVIIDYLYSNWKSIAFTIVTLLFLVTIGIRLSGF